MIKVFTAWDWMAWGGAEPAYDGRVPLIGALPDGTIMIVDRDGVTLEKGLETRNVVALRCGYDAGMRIAVALERGVNLVEFSSA